MKHRTSALKSWLLGSAALTLVGLSAAMSQERSQMPGGPSPAATQSKDSEPAARENRNPSASGDEKGRRGSKAQDASPSAAQPGDKNPRATQKRDDVRKPPKGSQAQDRDTPPQKDNQAKDRDTKRDRNLANERDSKRDRDQAQDRDGKRDRDQARERDTKRDQNQAKDRDAKRDRDEVRERDGKRDRDQARERDGKRDQARETDRRQDREDGRAGERQATEQQRTRISTSIRQANVRPVRNVNFSISVGAVVPASVRFYPVTPAIVEIYPDYRGYEFVLVEEEIVIVEPRTRKIVTVIDIGGSGRAASRTRANLSLTEKQREVVRRAAIQRRTTGSARTTTIEREYVIGEDIPETIEFEMFPDTIYAEVPEIRSYRYVVRDDDVYVIDPTERRVIEIIR